MKKYVYVDNKAVVIAILDVERNLCKMQEMELDENIIKNCFDDKDLPNYIFEHEQFNKDMSVEEFNALQGGKLRLLTAEEKEELFKPIPQEPTQLDRIEESIKEINATLSGTNEYKQAYETLTDGAKVEPLVMRKNIQALFASADSTSIVNAEPFVDEWKAGTMNEPIEYKIGDVRKENGQVYECKQAHTHHGEEGWNPSTFKAGWIVKHTKDKTNPKPYIQPQGSHDAYMKDECVSWNGKVYVSKVDNNVYSPTDYAQNWEVVG